MDPHRQIWSVYHFRRRIFIILHHGRTTATATDPYACLFYREIRRFRTGAQYLYLRGFREAGRVDERKARDGGESMTQLLQAYMPSPQYFRLSLPSLPSSPLPADPCASVESWAAGREQEKGVQGGVCLSHVHVSLTDRLARASFIRHRDGSQGGEAPIRVLDEERRCPPAVHGGLKRSLTD